jgi:pyruvate, water dikinase
VTLVLDLADIRATDAHRVGAKMARLGELAARGLRIPDGYAVTADALADTVLTDTVLADPVSAALRDAVAAAHERLRNRTGRGAALTVAVRSSGVSEDGATASFAGQYDTYLGITGIDDVIRHIVKCRESGSAARAQAYQRRFAAGAGTERGGLAVGVLELIDVRSAGVAFTLDPVTGDRDRLVVEANWGFGESVVSGHVSPDHWVIDRASGEIRERRTGATRQWSAADPDTGLVTLRPLPADRAGRPCLTDNEVQSVCAQATAIEAAEGCPQDVEWAIANDAVGTLFILQHRPETGGNVRDQNTFDPVQYALRNVFKVPGA